MFHVITHHQKQVLGCKQHSKPLCWYYYRITYIKLIMDYGSRTADKCLTGIFNVLVLLLYYIYSIYAWIMEHVKIRISV